MRRHAAVLAMISLSLALVSCGGRYARISEDEGQSRSIEIVPEDKATEVKLVADYLDEQTRSTLANRYEANDRRERGDASSRYRELKQDMEAKGKLCFRLHRDLTGPLYIARARVISRAWVEGREANIGLGALGIIGGGVSLWNPDMWEVWTGKEADRSPISEREVVDTTSARPTGRTGTYSQKPLGEMSLTFDKDGQRPAAKVLANDGAFCFRVGELYDEMAAGRTEAVLWHQGRPVALSGLRNFLQEIGAHLDKAGFSSPFQRNYVGAQLGVPERQYQLGWNYIQGQGVPQNEGIGFRWIQSAAQLGNGAAQYDLARFHDQGWHANHSVERAYFWAMLATARTDGELRAKAEKLRDQLRESLSPDAIVSLQAEAQRWGPASVAPAMAIAAVNRQEQPPTMPPLDPNRVSASPRPKALALVVGIDGYRSLPRASYAEDDARDFAAFAHTALGVPEGRIRLLTGEQATRLAVDKAVLNWLRAEVTSESEVFLFFSGHGLGSLDGDGDPYLVPWDGDLDLLSRSGVNLRELAATLSRIGALRVTVFIDACYSGGARDGNTLLAAAKPVRITARSPWALPNFSVFTASGPTQIASALDGAKRGNFSYWLMRGLEGEADANGDHRITASELAAFIGANVPREAHRIGREQTPVFEGDGEAVVVRW